MKYNMKPYEKLIKEKLKVNHPETTIRDVRYFVDRRLGEINLCTFFPHFDMTKEEQDYVDEILFDEFIRKK